MAALGDTSARCVRAWHGADAGEAGLRECARDAARYAGCCRATSAMPPLPSRSSAWALDDAPVSTERRRPRVLIVDDDVDATRLLARFLREYEVVTACDGEEGLDRAIAARPDVVITDLWMPRVDGLSFVRELKLDPALRRVPVIFVTAVTDPASVAAVISAGARQFLPKPIESQRLLRAVQRALG